MNPASSSGSVTVIYIRFDQIHSGYCQTIGPQKRITRSEFQEGNHKRYQRSICRPPLLCDGDRGATFWYKEYVMIRYLPTHTLATVVKRSQPLPENPPALNAMIRMVASLGGFIDRPKNEPGPQTLWIGLQRLHCFSLAWDSFGPEGSESSANG